MAAKRVEIGTNCPDRFMYDEIELFKAHNPNVVVSFKNVTNDRPQICVISQWKVRNTVGKHICGQYCQLDKIC